MFARDVTAAMLVFQNVGRRFQRQRKQQKSNSKDGITFHDFSVSGSSCQVNQQLRINERKLEKIDGIHRQNIIHTF